LFTARELNWTGLHVANSHPVVRRYNWHSAGSLGWPLPVLKYQYIFQIKYTETILSNRTRELLWFENIKMLIAVYEKNMVSFIIIFGTLSFPIGKHVFRTQFVQVHVL